MMVTIDPGLAAIHDTPNKSLRQNVARRGVILHHGALTSLDYLRSLVMGAKQVSSTGIVKDDIREGIVWDDRYRPWSMSSAYWDSACRCVETANESTNGWTISDESHWSLAILVAYWAQKDGFWPHRDGARSRWTVFGHREIYAEFGDSYATSCPGGMDLDLVTQRAQHILRGGAIPAGLGTTIPIEEKEEDMAGIIIVKVVGGTDRFKNAVVAFSPKRARLYVGSGDQGSANVAAKRIGQAKNDDGSYFIRLANGTELSMLAHAHGVGISHLDELLKAGKTGEIDVQLREILQALKGIAIGDVTVTADPAAIAKASADEIDARARKRLA